VKNEQQLSQVVKVFNLTKPADDIEKPERLKIAMAIKATEKIVNGGVVTPLGKKAAAKRVPVQFQIEIDAVAKAKAAVVKAHQDVSDASDEKETNAAALNLAGAQSDLKAAYKMLDDVKQGRIEPAKPKAKPKTKPKTKPKAPANSKGDEPKGDEPKGDEPKGDEPKGDEPKGDEPKGDDSKGDEPEKELTPAEILAAAETAE
jgi:hypothetical protein